MSCPTCGPYPTSPDDVVATSPLAPCDPEAVAAKVTVGKLLGKTWADTMAASKVVLLARYGETLARLMGNGYIAMEDGVARVVSKIALRVDELWVTYERPTPRAAVAGNPPDFSYMVAVNENGECFAMPGRTSEDSIAVWNFTSRKWEVRPASTFPICIQGKLTGASEIELIGFDPLSPDDDDFEGTTRCIKGLCGQGMLVLEERLAPGECFHCEQPVDCGTSVARAVQFPDPEDTTAPVHLYALVNSSINGPGWREITTLEGGGIQGPIGPAGPAGASGAPGAAGSPGAPGPAGPAGVAGPIGPSGGPIGPTGATGTIGPTGPQGPAGPTGATGAQGATGAAGLNGAPGAPGAPGQNGGLTNPSPSDLAKLSTNVQRLERHVDLTIASGTIASAAPIIADVAVQSVVGVTMPHLTTGGELVSIDAILVNVVADSIDPQQDEAGTHNLIISLNNVKAVENGFTFAGTMGVAGVFPRLDQIHASNELYVPWTGSPTNGLMVFSTFTNTKFATLPAGSVIPKYGALSGTYKVILKGFLVTRKIIPVFTP